MAQPYVSAHLAPKKQRYELSFTRVTLNSGAVDSLYGHRLRTGLESSSVEETALVTGTLLDQYPDARVMAASALNVQEAYFPSTVSGVGALAYPIGALAQTEIAS
jgi:hypothetical protein